MDLVVPMLAPLWSMVEPHLWWLAPLVIATAIMRFPLSRSAVMQRAGRRCESPRFVAWGRCRAAATEVDHVMPWSKGGPTVFSNGQALCRMRNRAKGARVPTWWYVLAVMDLEERAMRQRYPKDELMRRRRTFFEGGSSVEA